MYGAFHSNRPILADARQHAAEDWQSKPTVVSPKTCQVNRRDNTEGSTQVSRDDIDAPRKRVDSGPSPPQYHRQSSFGAEGNSPDDPLQAWQHGTERVATACGTFTGFDFGSLREKIAGMMIPNWVKMVPNWVNKLQNEISMAPWSLSWECWEEAHDPEINPEIIWDAQVRISNDLCVEEQAFLRKRQRHTTKALARYLRVLESEVHPDDVPIIGMCGSGGGLRALVAGASSYLSAAEDGLFDCITYSAGVSGSCWLQTLYYSSIGQQNHGAIINHLKDRIGVHIAYPPALLSLLSQAPTNKYLLSGLVEKLRGVPDADFGLVDVYGLALAARLLVPKSDLRISSYDLKISNQRFYVNDGQQPLPLYTAVRHEIPDAVDDVETLAKEARFTAKHYDYFQWFEWTPYELFGEELNAGIPTWAVGRKWQGGSTVWRENGLALPELRVPLMMGIWGSAFCATLSHYYREIRPILKVSGMSGLDALLAGKNDDLVKVHPIDPAVIPNFALGLRDTLPASLPESIHTSSHLQLMDAGMANNLPIYPLLRSGRKVDVVIAFDASADIRGDNWIKVVDSYVRQRNIKGWPLGAGWPQPNAETKTAGQLDDGKQKSNDETKDAMKGTKYPESEQQDLGYCTVWAGSLDERQEYIDEPVPMRIESSADEHHLKSSNAGTAVIYFPFLANEKVPGVNPLKSEFMSTWNFIYTPEQIDNVVALARANYQEGREQTRRTIRAVWERKRTQRLQREKESEDLAWRSRVRRGETAMRRNGDVGHGDHFCGL